MAKGFSELRKTGQSKALAIEPNSLAALINLGAALKEQGKFQEAADCYRKVLAIQPNSLTALTDLSGVLVKQGESQEAIAYSRKALAIQPNSLAALINLGAALQEQGKFQEAIACYRKVLAIQPNSLLALINLGAALKEQGECQEAIACCRKVLAMQPNSLAALVNLGAALKEQGECQEAIAYFRKALAIQPNSLPALMNLGDALKQQGEFREAADCYRKVLAIQPNSLVDLISLGDVLKGQGELQEAIACYRKALAIKSDSLAALISLGGAFVDQGEPQEAAVYCKKALAIQPNSVAALTNLGASMCCQEAVQEAITIYRKAISLNKDFPYAHFNLSMSLLSSGDYENGWEEYEWRFHAKGAALHGPQPQLKKWDGCNNPSRNRLVLVGEQGLGDTLQFMRYIPSMSKRGMSVAFCTHIKLHDLILASGITTEVYSSEEILQLTTGEWLPLLSLPRHLNIRPDNPLVSKSYIKVPEEKILYWKQKLSSEKRPIIGLNWQGNFKAERGFFMGRSVHSLETLAPITEAIDASFLSLQKGSGAEQLTNCSFLDRFVGCQGEINQTWDFVENAAMAMNCDLIITVDTVVAHLAGGLGKPTWLLLHKFSDWRWGKEGDTTFWYPSMRLFRQREYGNWQEVMHRVAMALETFSFNQP